MDLKICLGSSYGRLGRLGYMYGCLWISMLQVEVGAWVGGSLGTRRSDENNMMWDDGLRYSTSRFVKGEKGRQDNNGLGQVTSQLHVNHVYMSI